MNASSINVVFVVDERRPVGIKQTDDRLWLASFMTYDLGYFDEDSCQL